MDKCRACPSRCDGCLSIESGHARFCELADDSHPDHDSDIVRILEVWCEGKTMAKADASQPGRDIPLDMKIGRMIAKCEYRKPPACGCPHENPTCTHPDKSGEKWYLDCYQCKLSEMRTG